MLTMWSLDDGVIFVLVSSFTAIKVNCQGSCGISNKLNDSSWAVEEQYFNSTLSVADKGSSLELGFVFFHDGKETKASAHYSVPRARRRSGTEVACLIYCRHWRRRKSISFRQRVFELGQVLCIFAAILHMKAFSDRTEMSLIITKPPVFHLICFMRYLPKQAFVLRWLQQASVEMGSRFSFPEPLRARAFSGALGMIRRGHFRYNVTPIKTDAFVPDCWCHPKPGEQTHACIKL